MQFHIHGQSLAITHPRRADALAAVAQHFDQGQGFALATLNMDHLVKLRRNGDFLAAYQAQEIVVADGNPITWLGRIAGERLELVPGSDLVLPLCAVAAAKGLPVSMLGASADALQGAKAYLEREIPGFKAGLLIAPPMGFDPQGEAAQAALAKLAELGPGLCLIALGAPKQELFAALGRQIAPQMGFASVGAGVEFLSGHQKRAPAWVRAIAMEWAWRAASAPRRLVPRYAACFAILPSQIWAAWSQRKKQL